MKLLFDQKLRTLAAVWFCVVASSSFAVPAGPPEVRVRFHDEVRSEPFSGRVYVFFSRAGDEPRKGPDWFAPEPFAAINVKDLAPGEEVIFGMNGNHPPIRSFPAPWQELEVGEFRAQAVMRFNPFERQVGAGPGNGFSSVVELPADATEPVVLTVDRIVPEPAFHETMWTKLLRVRSKQLSEFHGRDVFLEGAETFDRMEQVLGPGGQLHSFEAVFSPRGNDGAPRLLWDRETGAIDPETARAWEAYDIRLVLERNWEALGPRLAGKLHVFMGGEDTFYLDGAVRLLKESLEKLESDAVLEIHEGKDHRTLLTDELRLRIRHEMAEAVLRED